jgi:hypothetical protein
MAEVVTKRRREPVDHPERVCANPECRQAFKPIRATQSFHAPDCRKAHWRKAYHWTPHPCPLCTIVHDPEEAPILDALERLVIAQSRPGTGGLYDEVWARDIKDFIGRRRAILRGEVVGVASS